MVHEKDPAEKALLERVRVAAAKLEDEVLTTLARKIVKETADAQARGAKKNKEK